MSSQWEPAATKGRLALEVITMKRALRDGLIKSGKATFEVNGDQYKASVEVRGTTCHYLMRMTPDGSDPIDVLSPDEASVRSFIKEMEPHTLHFLVSDLDESEESVRAAVEGRMQ